MSSGTTAPVLELESISKSFGATRALRNGRLEIRAGEVHAIVGENGAGKSTLMGVMSGSVQPDAGSILIDGHLVQFAGPREATEAGIAIVHQELALCPDVSVAENVYLDQLPTRGGIIRFREINQKTRELLALFESEVDPRAKTAELSLADQQIVEIAHAMAHDCRVIIFDEPTSSLTGSEAEALHRLIRQLSKRGVASVYISHRLSEVFELSDRITVMRDGEWVATMDTSSTSPNAIVERMVGRKVETLYPPKSSSPGDVVLQVDGISGSRFEDVSFVARSGEILGVSGLIGAGRSEVMRAVVGVDRREGGAVLVEGEAIAPNRYARAIDSGLVYMSEDRKHDGLFLNLSIESNIIVAVLQRLSRAGLVRGLLAHRTATKAAQKLRTKMASVDQAVGDLSGGNQQKAMVAKWLVCEPKVLILDEPTRGIDVGAKLEIHALLRQLADDGLAIVMVSSELEEVIGLSDRVLVMREGRLVGEVSGDVTEQAVMNLAAGPAEQMDGEGQ